MQDNILYKSPRKVLFRHDQSSKTILLSKFEGIKDQSFLAILKKVKLMDQVLTTSDIKRHT